jgi:nucleotide-binding universal stress UspA family protein
MNRFKNILFVYTGQTSDSFAFERALRLAESNQARLSLLASYEPVPTSGKIFLGKEKLDEINQALAEKLNLQVDDLIVGHEESLQHRLISSSRSFLEIIYKVLEHQFDLVIKIKEDYGSQNTLSSIDMHLLRKCPCPVWVINGGKQQKFSRVLAAIDPSPTEAERVKLQYEILKLAVSVAKREQAELDVLYAWKFYAEATLKGPRFNMTDEQVAGLARHERRIHKNWLDETVEPFENTEMPFNTHLQKGPASKVILEFIEKKQCDLLIMGTVARTGIPGLIIGNTAETVLGQARFSILTIKPTGFRSPVKLVGRNSR